MSQPNRPFAHTARKRFGQNFLVDDGIIDKIVRAIAPTANDNIVEIGPGKGAITALLLADCPRLNVIELDRDLIPILLAQFAKYDNFNIHQTDALKFDFSTLASEAEPLRVVGNLPYNISTPLIFHLLSYHHQIHDMHFMLQKEVVDRMTAQPGDKAYGRLGIMTQYYCQVVNLFPVPPTCFRPQPKVDSAIVRLIPHKTLPHPATDIKLFKQLVNTAFQQRRKTLRNALKQMVAQEHLEALDIDTSRRPETLSLADFVDIANLLAALPAADG